VVVLPLFAGLLAVGVLGAGVAAVGLSIVMRVQRPPPLLGMLTSRVWVTLMGLSPLLLLLAAPPLPLLAEAQLLVAELSLAVLLLPPPLVAERPPALLTLRPVLQLSPLPLRATRRRLTSSSWRTACLKAGGKWRWRAGDQRAAAGAAASTTLGLQLRGGLLPSWLSTWSEQMPTLASCSACQTPASSAKADSCRVLSGMEQGAGASVHIGVCKYRGAS
jgi:hypothetical protein